MFKLLVSAAALATVTATAASAVSLTVYTDEEAFLAALGGNVYLEDFETATVGSIDLDDGEIAQLGSLGFTYEGDLDVNENDPFPVGNGEPRIIADGIIDGSQEFIGEVNTSTSPSPRLTELPDELLALGGNYNISGGIIDAALKTIRDASTDGQPAGIHTFIFPFAVYAFGADFFNTTTGADLTLNLLGVEIRFTDYADALGPEGTGFLGVISDTPFTFIYFDVEGNSESEVFRMDNVVYSPIPLPASAWLMIGALAGLGALRRWNTRSA